MGDNVPIEPVGGDAGDGEEEEEEWDEEEWDEDDFDYEEELDVWDGALDLADDGFSESEEDSEYESMEEDEDVQSLFNSNMPGAEALVASFTTVAKPVQYKVSTKRYHQQVADALLCRPEAPGEGFPSSGTEVLLLDGTQGRRGSRITLARMAGEGGASPSIARESTPPPASIKLLDEAALPFSPYSMARSSCGRHVAVCGSSSSFAIYSLGPEASGNRPTPKLSLLSVGVILGAGLADMDPLHGLMASAANMNNSVRFGSLWGQERIIISCQVGSQMGHILVGNHEKPNYAYIFNVPSPSKPGRPSQQLPCLPPALPVGCDPSTLGARCHSVEGSTVVRVSTKPIIPNLHDDPFNLQSLDTKTAVLGPFPSDLNCIQVSPDGQWVAAVADTLELYLVQLGGNNSSTWLVQECLTVPLQTPAERAVPTIQSLHNQSGSQYVAWNRSGSLVAATTDLTGRIFVYNVAERQLVGSCHLKLHPRPCMALSWSPFHDNIIAYAEDCGRVHVMDVRGGLPEEPWRKCQVLSPPSTRENRPSQEEIHGLGWGGSAGSPELFVATARQLLKWPVLGNQWTPERHLLYPPRLKDTAAALLKFSLTDPDTGEPRHPTG
eukprot:CAMPEP_0117670860 /NCGR_PEP_ID=MMETSP0804-20121206/13006_1 /TAXON_ID=1074897 /ORGANISM="Tetraselmis astigmatica, Strain CCMP880" /LENGTH=608 /DNA_ID=CAMNT_0005479243 /DNA_START=144 /DNA_END=1966 /DNA_ORIENTATION=+